MHKKIVESFDKTKIDFNHLEKGGRDTAVIICHLNINKLWR